MGQVFDHVRRAVKAERYVFSDHADNMLRERGITHWQIVAGLDEGRLLMERQGAKPNDVAEIEQLLADGTAVKAV